MKEQKAADTNFGIMMTFGDCGYLTVGIRRVVDDDVTPQSNHKIAFYTQSQMLKGSQSQPMITKMHRWVVAIRIHGIRMAVADVYQSL